MSKKYQNHDVATENEDLQFIYQGVSYIVENEYSKAIVILSIEPLEKEDEHDEEEVLLYLVQVEEINVDILIDEADLKFQLKQTIIENKYWKFKTVGLSVPTEKEITQPLGLVINLDEKVIDVIFDLYS